MVTQNLPVLNGKRCTSSKLGIDRCMILRVTRRKVDIWLLPLLGMLYALALIDRTNLGVARITGMDADLVCAFQLPCTTL